MHEDDETYISEWTKVDASFPTPEEVQQMKYKGVRMWEIEVEAPAIIFLPCWLFHGFESCAANNEVSIYIVDVALIV